MMSIEMRTRGLSALMRTLDNIANNMPNVMDETVAYIASEAQIEAKQRAPVDTGFLRDNITIEKVDLAYYVVTSEAPYSIFQEFGFTHYITGQFIPGVFYMTFAKDRALAIIEEGAIDVLLQGSIAAEIVPAYDDPPP